MNGVHLPLLGFKGGGIVTTDFGYSRFYEISPISLEALTVEELGEFLRRATVFINGVPAENVFLQFVLDVSPVPKRFTDAHKKLHENHPVISTLAEARVRHFSQLMWWNSIIVIHVPIDPEETYDRALELRDKVMMRLDSYVKENLRAALGIEHRDMSSVEAFRVIVKQLNPGIPDPEIPEITNLDEKSFLLYPAEQWRFLALPEDRFNTLDYAQDSNGFFEVLALDNFCTGEMPFFPIPAFLSAIDFPIRVTLNIHIPKQVKEQREIEKRSFIANIFSGKRRFATIMNKQHVEEVRAFFESIASRGQRIIRVGLLITYWDQTIKGLKYKESRIRTVLGTTMRNTIFHREVFQRPIAFTSSIAGFPTANLRWRWASSELASTLLPIMGPMVGTIMSPRSVFVTRWGTPSFIDLFDNRASRWAFIVVAPTGSGKSVLTNYFIQTMMTSDPSPFVCVVDLASVSSYRPLVELLGGLYADVSYDTRFSLNLFDYRLGFDYPPPSTLAFVEDIIVDMITSENEVDIPKEKRAVLRRALRRCYDRIINENPKQIPLQVREGDGRFSRYSTWLEASKAWLKEALLASDVGQKGRCVENALYAHRMAMPIVDDLITTLAMDEVVLATSYDRDIAGEFRRRLEVIVEGPGSNLFNHPTSLSLTGISQEFNLICLNLKFLKDNLEHLVPFFLILRRHIYNDAVFLEEEIPQVLIDIYGRDHFVRLQKRPKVVIYDEFHNFRFSPKVLRVIDKDARQQRALGMLWGIVTQSLRDVDYESEGLKINLATSAAFVFLLRHSTPDNPREMEVSYVASKLGLNAKETEILRSLMVDPGFYSEIYTLAEGIGRGVLRFMPTSQDYWITTTHPRERPFRDAIIEDLSRSLLDVPRGKVVSMVIDYLAKRFPRGIRTRAESQVSVSDIVKEIEHNYYYQTSRKFIEL
ncbi:MAG: hypothetical protein QXY99_04475 [Thermoproteota archaeon]